MARPPHRLRPVDLDFLDTAPVRLSFTAAVAAPAHDVYHALAEELTSWPLWFAPVKRARTTRPGGREIVLVGGMRFEETVLAAERPSRYAYRADTANRPGMRAIAEDWRLAPIAGGSLVQWTLAAEPVPGAALFLRLSRPVLRSSFRRAMQKLDLRISGAGAGTAGH
jgi:uncharacterized protein YndB with AHSA1/START domain